jgi:hypothetical protein
VSNYVCVHAHCTAFRAGGQSPGSPVDLAALVDNAVDGYAGCGYVWLWIGQGMNTRFAKPVPTCLAQLVIPVADCRPMCTWRMAATSSAG